MSVGKPTGTYFVDANSPAEMARLQRHDRLTTKAMGGVVDGLDLTGVQTILDIACGPGGWVLDLAFLYPEKQVVGIDISQRMIDYAQTQAEVQQRTNARFFVMDALKPLEFPKNSFDLVNSRFIAPFMPQQSWMELVKECRRILRPGGTLRLTEFERAITNSLSHERVSSLFTQTHHFYGRTSSPDGNAIGILPLLPWFLQQTGFTAIQKKMFGIDYSFGEEAHEDWCHVLLTLFRLVKPYITGAALATEQEWERQYERVSTDMALPEFRALTPCCAVWGQVPLHKHP